MNAIDETIKQLEAARDRAIDLIAGLQEFRSGLVLPELPVPPAPATVIAPKPVKLVNITKSQPKRKLLNVRAKKTVKAEKPAATPAAPKPSPAKTPAVPTPPLRSFANLDKPESLGAAMKAIIRTLTKFTGEELRDQILADAHTKALHDAGSPGLLSANLTYWAKQGHLTTSGEETPLKSTYTIGNKEFFGA